MQDRDRAEYASQSGASTTSGRVISASPAEQQDQQQDNQNRTHERTFLAVNTRSANRNQSSLAASRAASLAPPTAFWTLPATFSALPSACVFASPTNLPAA